MEGLLDTTGGYWIRSQSADKRSAYSFIAGTENSPTYTLTAEDDGRYIAFQYAQKNEKNIVGQKPHEVRKSGSTGGEPLEDDLTVEEEGRAIEIKRTINSLGPVLPGPPRILDLRVGGSGHGEAFRVGSEVTARGTYIGGKEGLSEYWWFKIAKGKRVQLSEPLSVLNNVPGNHDPRVYVLREEDAGCVLKVSATLHINATQQCFSCHV